MTAEESGDKSALSDASDGEYDPHFSPIVTLPEVVVPTYEEDEVEVLKLRAKLYRFDRSGAVPEWKERGTGEVKMLRHDTNKTVRIVMRRDKTLKVCANHFITPLLDIKPKPGHDKVFVYTTPADFSNESVQSECFAIKFGKVEYAEQFNKTFLESQKFVKEECKLYNGQADDEDDDDGDLEYEDSDENEEENSEEAATAASKKDKDCLDDKMKKLEVSETNTDESVEDSTKK